MGDNRRRVSFEGSEREERGAGWLLGICFRRRGRGNRRLVVYMGERGGFSLLRASIFEYLIGDYLFEFAIFIHKFLKAFRVSHLHSTIFSSLSIEGLHADILFTANLFGGLITVGLADDSDDVFGLMFLLFHVLV